jgi:DNA-binding response OmpR family regulator
VFRRRRAESHLIVIIEHDPDMARMLDEALSDEQCATLRWDGRQDALRLIRRWRPGLVVLGIGSQTRKATWILLNQLRADERTASIPILFICPDRRTVEEQGSLLRSEGYAIIEAPFELGDLLSEVRDALARSAPAPRGAPGSLADHPR